MTSCGRRERLFYVMNTAMDSAEKQENKSATDDDLVNETNDIFRHVREVSHLVAKARFQAREADIRARYAAEFAERAVSEAQLAHMVASALAKTGRVVASMVLELANSGTIETSGDREFLSVSIPDSNCSLQSGDSSGNASMGASFESPVSGVNQSRHSPPEDSSVPLSAAPRKHETAYPEDLSPVSSLSDLLCSSKHLPTVWEDSYSNGWESTPEPWADKKNTLHVLRKFHFRKENKQTECASDEDGSENNEEEFPAVCRKSSG